MPRLLPGASHMPLKIVQVGTRSRGTSPDYSPVTHLLLILCTSPEDHHREPSSQPQGRRTMAVTSWETQRWRVMPTVSSQQDWPAQIRDASST